MEIAHLRIAIFSMNELALLLYDLCTMTCLDSSDIKELNVLQFEPLLLTRFLRVVANLQPTFDNLSIQSTILKISSIN